MKKTTCKTVAVSAIKCVLIASPVIAPMVFAIDATTQTDIDAGIASTDTIVDSIVVGLIGVVIGITGFGIVKSLLKS